MKVDLIFDNAQNRLDLQIDISIYKCKFNIQEKYRNTNKNKRSQKH